MAQIARIAISIDLDHPQNETSDHAAALLKQLLSAAEQAVVPVTCSTGEFGSRRVQDLAASPHEIALAATAQWAAASVDRTQFANTLGEKIAAAESAGIEIRSIVLGAGCTLENRTDLLVRHRLKTVHLAEVDAIREELSRYGVPQAPQGIRIDGDYFWWSGGPRASVRKALHSAIQHAEPIHIQLNLARIVELGRENIALGVLKDAGNRCRFGLAQPVTFRQFVSEHRVLRTGTGHSALRAA